MMYGWELKKCGACGEAPVKSKCSWSPEIVEPAREFEELLVPLDPAGGAVGAVGERRDPPAQLGFGEVLQPAGFRR